MELDAWEGGLEVTHIVVNILTVAHVRIGSLTTLNVVVGKQHRVGPRHLEFEKTLGNVILVLLGSVLVGLWTREDLATVVVKYIVGVFLLHDEAVLVDHVMVREQLLRIGRLDTANLIVQGREADLVERLIRLTTI